MVQANHHSKSERLASDRPFANGTILNQNVKMFGIGIVFCFPSPVFEPPLYNLLLLRLPFLSLFGILTYLRQTSLESEQSLG